MEARKNLKVIIGILILVLLGLNSCSTSKKSAISCPEYSKDQKYSKVSHRVGFRHIDNPNNKKLFIFNHFEKKISFKRKRKIKNLPKTNFTDNLIPNNTASSASISNEEISITDEEILTASIDKSFIPSKLTIASIESNLYIDSYEPSINFKDKVKTINQPNECDIMTLKNGEEINAKVIEIGQDEIKYKKCENLNGPIISINKSEVLMIKYPNGTKDIYTTTDTISNNVDKSEQKIEGLGLAGFIIGLVGLNAIPLGIIAVVFGLSSLKKIKKNPEKYKGRGFAIVSVVIGAFEVLVALLVLAWMLNTSRGFF